MINLLVPVDGSESSNRAVDHLLKMVKVYKDTVKVHLLNAQHSLTGDVAMFVSRDQIEKYHHEQGEKALAPARARLEGTGIACEYHISVGDPAKVITQYARDHRCDQIVMGARGLGSIAGLLLGSVTTKVIQLTDVPVLLVK